MPQTPQEKYLAIFDFDGTLVDTAPGILSAFETILLRHRLTSAMPYEERRYWSMYGSRALITRAWPTSISPAETEGLIEELIEEYRQTGLHGGRLFAGVKEALDVLQSKGWHMAVCSNKRSEFLHIMIENLGLSNYFALLVGGDTYPSKKPSAEPLLEIMRHLGASPKNCVMVGDTSIDLLAAHAAGLPCILFDFYNTGAFDRLEKNFSLIYSWDVFVPRLKDLFPLAAF